MVARHIASRSEVPDRHVDVSVAMESVMLNMANRKAGPLHNCFRNSRKALERIYHTLS